MLQCSTTHTVTQHCPTCTCGDGQRISLGELIGYDLHEIFQIRRMLRPISIDLSFLRPAMIEVEPWLFELQQTPRRMKRPYPSNLPGPPQCHFNSRPRHRRLMRIRRQWRNRRSPSGYSATAASSMARSRNGNTVAAVLSAHRR